VNEARRIMPESRKEICRDQASWSSVGSTCFARIERTLFMGSVVEEENDVELGHKRS